MIKGGVAREPWIGSVLLVLLLAAAPTALGQVAVVTDPATAVSATSATLHGTVNGNGEDISAVYFDYGPAIPYDHTFLNAVPFNVPAAQGQTPVSLAVAGLACGTAYHFRVTVDDMNGRNLAGGDLTFTTQACSRPEVAVPTLASWNLLALAGMIAAVAWWQRRRSQAR